MELGIRGLGPGVRIGLGASAAVYRARQEQLGRDVAVKLLTERDPSFVRRFEREALALGQLSRLPGILTVHDTGLTEQGEPYLVLQYCPSSLLDRLHREGPLRPAEAARLIARVAVTVAGAHEAGIVHRDLKPANILLTHEGEPLVADLGMASVLGAGITTSIGFTPGYAAPENLRGEAGGPDVDVYALGASLFQLVTGRVPFTDPTGLNNLVALAVAIDSQPVEDLRPLGVPDGLCRLIEAAMAKDPARRPTAAALAEQLAAVAERIADVGQARPAAPAGHPRAPRLPASGPAPATIDAADAAGPGVGPLTPPRPAGTEPVGRFGPSPVDDGPAAPSDLPPGFPPHRAAPPEPWNGGRRLPVPARQRRWLSNVTILGGAGVAAAAVVALLSSLLPTVGEGGGQATATTTATFSPTTIDPSSFAGGGTTWGPSMEDSTSSMAAYQLQWEAGRERALNGLTGPGVLDTVRPTTGTCPDGWSETAGVDSASIILDLQVADPTDETSEAVRLAQGVTAYLNWVNANGGIGPDQLTVAPRLVDGAAGTADRGATSPPFAVAALDAQLVGPPGAADNSAEAACIPRPLSVSRDPVADPTVTPWTTPGPELSLATEARLWTELIAGHLAGAAGPGTATTMPPTTATTSPATTATAIPTPPPTPTTAATTVAPGAEIVGLVGPSETGTLYRQAFEQAQASHPSGLPVRFITSPEELTVGPEVLIVMGSPQDCQAALAILPEAALAARLKLMAAPCAASDQAGQLAQAQAWYHLPGGLRDATAYYYGDDAFQRLIDDELRAAGLDPNDRVIRRGFGLYGWLWQQSLEIAAALPGGLTRSNLVASQRQLAGLTHPMLLDGVRLQSGTGDPWLVEGSDVGIGNGSSQGGWLLDVNGQTPACRWADAVTRSCQPPG